MSSEIKYYLLLVLFVALFGCADISKADQSNTRITIPDSSVNNQTNNNFNNQKEINNLYVFVGEKISVEEFDSRTKENEFPMDRAFRAKYKVLKNVYGDYQNDIIEFDSYDHYGFPPFAKHKAVLLFVSEYEGKLYHEKYQYFDVNKTEDGRWASCGDPYRFDEYHRKSIKTDRLEFNEPLFFDLTEFEDKYIKAIFKEPYFKVSGSKAECLTGAYIEDLFIVKKEGVLKARGLFK